MSRRPRPIIACIAAIAILLNSVACLCGRLPSKARRGEPVVGHCHAHAHGITDHRHGDDNTDAPAGGKSGQCQHCQPTVGKAPDDSRPRAFAATCTQLGPDLLDVPTPLAQASGTPLREDAESPFDAADWTLLRLHCALNS